MNLLVVGASGFIGYNIFAHAKQNGFNVIGTSCSRDERGTVKFNLRENCIEDVIPSGFFKDGNCCAVICSAIIKIDECWNNQEKSNDINVTKTIKLLNTLNCLGVKSVFISSEGVFDGERGYYNEDILPNPINLYGQQKVIVENYITKNIPSCLIVRLSVVVSSNPREDHLFNNWMGQVAQNKPIECIANQVFSPTDVNDVARGILIAISKDMRGIYHLSNSEFFHRDELARQFLYATKTKSEILVNPLESFKFKEKRALVTYLDGSKFASETGLRFNSIRNVLHALHEAIG